MTPSPEQRFTDEDLRWLKHTLQMQIGSGSAGILALIARLEAAERALDGNTSDYLLWRKASGRK